MRWWRKRLEYRLPFFLNLTLPSSATGIQPIFELLMLFTLSKAPAFPLALGGAGLGSDDKTVFFNGPVSEQDAVATVLWAMDNGINLIDTSPFYGSSEKRIGIAVKEFGKREVSRSLMPLSIAHSTVA